MNVDLQILIKLQALDIKINRLRKSIDDIPREIDELKHGLLNKQKELHDLDEEINQEEKKRKSLERTVEDEKTLLEKSKRKIPEVKTNKEYSALLAEIDKIEKTIYSTEDEILIVMESLEGKEALKKEREISVKSEEEAFHRQEEKKNRELELLNRELERELEGKASLTAELKKPLQELYERVRQTRSGIAVVNVVDEVCQGCHMALPPQVVAQVIRGEEVILCNHCNRILFIAP